MEDDKPEPEPSFNGGSDICQQLMDRYGKSSAPQHRHLVATAAAMRSILAADYLPLSPPAYFAAVISSAEASAANPPLDAAATAALLTFLAIVLPLVPPRGIDPERAAEAARVMAALISDSLGAAGVRAGVKCLGGLVGFCDLEDWDSVRVGFEALMKFSVDKRPKVRRCSQECLEKAFKSINNSAVIKEASKLVMTMLKSYMPLAVELSTLGTSSVSKDDISSEPNNVEVLHVLNMLKIVVPFLSMKTRSRVLCELNTLLKCRFSTLTRPVFKTIETCFESSKADVIGPITENILVSLASYIALGDKNPSDTVISATTLLKCSLDILRDGESGSYSKNRPLVFNSISGLLTSEASIASHASATLEELLNNHVDSKSLSEVAGTENTEACVVKSICVVLENGLMTSHGKPNEYILKVISALFLKLRDISYHYMRSILLKLADAMAVAAGNKYDTNHLENCIGSAVIAMGPETISTDIPVTLDVDDLTCSNIWLLPILKNYVVGASLEHYIQHILRLAKSFREASRQVKKTPIGRNLQDQADALWGLLPSFCRYPTDLYQNAGPLSEVFIKFLKKKDSFMHENVAVSLQVLVNQNRNALNNKTDPSESKFFEGRGSLIESTHLPTYSKKIATKNLKALASHSTALLEALADLFIDSAPAKRSFLRDAIGCLAYITDSSITKKILMSLFERFSLVNEKGEFGGSENLEDLSTEEQGSSNAGEKDAEICILMELASALVGGAKEDLIDLIYNFIKHSFKVTDDISHQQAYHTLSRVLEEHAWFCSLRFIELIDLMLDSKPPIEETETLRSRFACFHPLVVHLMKLDSEEENAKSFFILNEIILTLKDAKEEEARKVAYDVLLKISSSLRVKLPSDSDSCDTPYQKLISMIMGYLSGASPHVKSGAVSALSVLIYSDPSISLSEPDIIPTLLSLLQGKSLELIKAALGSVKVLVSCLQARELQNILSNIAKGVLPWSSVSRNHFRSKVTIIMEILIRKCGISAVESVTPDKYMSFVKSVVESRQNRNSKDTVDSDTETKNKEKPTTRQEKRKRDASNDECEKSEPVKHRKTTDKNNFARKTGSKELNVATGDGGARSHFRGRQFGTKKFTKGRSKSSGQGQGRGRPNGKNFDKGPQTSHKKKMNVGSKDGAFRKPAGGSAFGKRKKLGRK